MMLPFVVRRAAAARLLRFSAFALAVALALPGCAATPAGGPPRVKLDFEKYALANGLEVILRRDTRVPIVAVNLWYHVGPADEAAGRTGFAHLFEHMMFQASGHVAEDQYFPILEGAGASFVNGSTDFDRTNYLEDLPSNQLETALWLESDRMGFLLDRLDAKSLAIQQDVVRNERRQGVEGQPYGLAEEELYHQLFPREHPYHASVIGSHADIQAARLEDVRNFFSEYYTPNNASLAIVGDIDLAQTKKLVEKYFGTIPRGPEVKRTAVAPPVLTAERRASLTDEVELPRVYMGWITPNAFQPGDAEAILAARLLGDGKTSRLYRELVYSRKIAQEVSAAQQSLALGSVFEIQLTAKPGHTTEELERAADAEIEKLAKEGPSAAELRAAQTSLYSEIVQGLENVGGFDGQANRFNLYNHYLGDPGYLQKDLDRLAAVTPEGVKAFVAAHLRGDRRAVVTCVPGRKVIPPGPPTPPAPAVMAQAVESREPWRGTQPAAGPVSTTPLPSAKAFDLPNGLKVLLVESHALPVVSAELVVRAGSSADPPGSPGLAGFAVSMLDEGAGERDALGIARDLDALGASLSTQVQSDGSVLSLTSLKGQVGAAMAILADVALRPTFPPAEVDRVRNDRLTSLIEARQDPFRTGIRVTLASLYGDTHPYGHLELGAEDALEAITRDDLVKFYGRYFSPSNAALVLAGDLTESEARRLATQAFGKWRGTGEVVGAPGSATPAAERVLVVDMPSAPQTALIAAQLSVARSDPDYEKLNVMNQVLGGLFSSRVNMNLREKHGYSYGAFSFIRENRGVGPLIVGSMVKGEVTGPALEQMMGEIGGMRAREISAAEMTLARESIARSLPALFETTGSTAQTIAALFLHDQSPDYYQSLPERLASMTVAEVFDATTRHLRPEDMRIVAVGNLRQIEPQIRRLRLGPLGVRSLEGKALQP